MLNPLDLQALRGIYCGIEDVADTLPQIKTVSAKQDRKLDETAKRLHKMAVSLRQLVDTLEKYGR